MGRVGVAPAGAGRLGARPDAVAHAVYGADAGGSERLWTMPDAHALAANDNADPTSRLDAEAGYGMALFGGGFTGTPNVGLGLSDTAREVRLGWRLSPAGAGACDFSFRIDASRRGQRRRDARAPHRVRRHLALVRAGAAQARRERVAAEGRAGALHA